MTDQLLARAQDGDEDAFTDLVAQYRPELRAHCYRILGSVHDADDALQETLMAAWLGLGRFEGRSSVRAWLYRIATNKCLNARRGARSRPLPEPTRPLPEPTYYGEPLWIEPYPEVLLDGLATDTPGPEARIEAREAISLAFVSAVQHLPPMQRAVLMLRDVMGFRAAEAAETLDCSVHAANSLLKRARARIARELPAREHAPLPDSPHERDIVARFTDAYENGDVATIVGLLTDDVVLTMPPLPFVYRGRATTAEFLEAVCATRHFQLVPTRANGQPAFGCYVYDGNASVVRAHGLIVLTLAGNHIAEITRFLDNSMLPRFGLPRTLHE